jgi:hypothetical protein
MVKMGSNVLQSRTRTSHKRVDPRYKEPSKPNLIIISYLQVMKSHGSSWRTYAKKIPDGLQEWYEDFLEANSIRSVSYEKYSLAVYGKHREHSVSNDVNNVFKTMLKLPKHVQDSITKAYDPDDYFRVKKVANTSKKLIG